MPGYCMKRERERERGVLVRNAMYLEAEGLMCFDAALGLEDIVLCRFAVMLCFQLLTPPPLRRVC
jgi:hypothetical protein